VTSARVLLLFCCVLWADVPRARGENPNWVQEALRSIPILNLGEPGEEAGSDASAEGYSTPHPAVARIVVPEPDGTTYGSGTLVDVRGEYGLVVTNWHVVETVRQELWVEFADGFRSAGKLLKVDRDWDLAAIAIWRPNGQPVALSKVAPKPGDELVIAGFGNGPFRAARGQCLQYVTPSLELPLEMVQVTAAARNGDSGGPIFNANGELAGVLFGTGEGVTSGSYCGRVNEFLASVLPKEPPRQTVAPTDHGDLFSKPSTTKPVADLADNASVVEPPIAPEVASHAPPATVSDFGLQDAVESPAAVDPEPAPLDAPPTARFGRPPDRDTEVDHSEAPPQATISSEVEWLELAGTSTPERLKTALAIIGLCTLIWHTVRIVGCGRTPASGAAS